MSVARVREINARLRAAGFVVHEWPGWETRGNGQASDYEGGIDHHTASAFGMALPGTGIGNLLAFGRSDLAGPLCNHADNEDGSITCIAAHPANHAGASGGRSMGPLPVTSLFNKRVLGLEIVYPGNVPMRPAQYRAALAWSRIVTDVCGYGDIQRARAHAETSITGKWDPGDGPSRTINMTAFRTAARTAGGNDNMDPNNPHDSAVMGRVQALALDEEVRTFGAGSGETMGSVVNAKSAYGRTQAVVQMLPQVVWGPATGEKNHLAEFLQGLKADLLAVKAGVAGLSDDESKILAAIHAIPTGPDVDEDTLAAALGPILAPFIQVGLTEGQVEAAMRRVFASASQPATNTNEGN